MACPQRCEKSIKRLHDCVLSRNRHLAQKAAPTSSEGIQAKKGAQFLPPPSVLPFKGEGWQHVSKGRKSSRVRSPHRQRKGGLVRDSRPKGQVCAGRGEMLPLRRQSPPGAKQRALGVGKTPSGLARFLLLSPQGPAASHEQRQDIWRSSFLTGAWLGKADCIFSASESRNHRAQRKAAQNF